MSASTSPYCHTTSDGSSKASWFDARPHRCCYALERVASNQHQRTEHLVCACGSRARRFVRWYERRVTWEYVR
jgi:hypothetical protein